MQFYFNLSKILLAASLVFTAMDVNMFFYKDDNNYSHTESIAYDKKVNLRQSLQIEGDKSSIEKEKR